MEQRDDPLTMFRDALSNPVTRDRYEKRLEQFFGFMNLKGESMQSRAQYFASKCKKNPSWAMSAIMNYMRYQKERAEKGEISTATL